MMMFGSAGPGSLAQCVKIDHESRLTDQRQLSILRATRPDGGIGRRGGFKIRFRKEWEFESPSGHQNPEKADRMVGFFSPRKNHPSP
jgi:hypothetical protein